MLVDQVTGLPGFHRWPADRTREGEVDRGRDRRRFQRGPAPLPDRTAPLPDETTAEADELVRAGGAARPVWSALLPIERAGQAAH